MSKVTFVVEFEDGKEPAVNAGIEILGGKLVSVAWRDAVNEAWFSVHDCLPPGNESVLLFDANGEGKIIGWRSLWYGMGQVETGEWEWSFQIEGMTDLEITHWAPIPEGPEDL